MTSIISSDIHQSLVAPGQPIRRRLNMGASQLEYFSNSPMAITIDPSWIHLGDPPNFQAFSEKGTFISFLKILARRGLRWIRPEVGRRPALYESTNFEPWVFNDGDKLRFEDNSFSFVYSEHFLEHLRFDVAIQLLLELKRVLAVGGVVRIVVPDADYRTYEPQEPLGFPSVKLPFHHPNKHKVRWNVYMLKSAMECAGLRAIPLVYCDENGNFEDRDPKHAYSNLQPIVDPEFVYSLAYIARRRSLVVDGLKARSG